MPKIVIREFDKTTAGSGAYSNFAVVVPGFVATGSWTDSENKAHLYGNNEFDEPVFDENGVYECSSRTEFKKYIGQISGQNIIVQPASAPILAELKEGVTIGNLSETEFNTLVSNGTLYEVTENTTTKTAGKYIDEDHIYVKAVAEEKDNYVFTDDTTEGVIYTNFAVLSFIGSDELRNTHYGNQIAYELLGLGYTILYKRLSSIEDLISDSFWSPLKDKSIYDFRYIISGCRGNSSNINSQMIGLAEFNKNNESFDNIDVLDIGRGDCVALLDIDAETYEGKTQSVAVRDVLSSVGTASKYAAYFAPYVTYKEVDESKNYGDNKTFPASFHYLACAARSAENYNEWYANAGYTRGISKYTVESVGCKFGEAAVNAFQPRFITSNTSIAVNPIIQLRGITYLWGNRTAEGLGVKGSAEGDLRASHFLNIRQLCTTIKKQVYVACRRFTYDPNSETLWTNFCNTIRPTLEKMKADQGIEDYKFIKVKNDRKAFLSAVIRIVPIEAVEDFDISIYLEDSLNGTIAVETEE